MVKREVISHNNYYVHTCGNKRLPNPVQAAEWFCKRFKFVYLIFRKEST